MTTREPEWDDYERAKFAAWQQFESEICECGLHESIAASDPDLESTVRICPICRDAAKNARVRAAEEEAELKKRFGDDDVPASHPRPSDGRYIGFRFRTPPTPTTS